MPERARHDGVRAVNFVRRRLWRFVCCRQVIPSKKGINFSIDPEKAEKWVAIIDAALQTSFLDSGSAMKLAGKLMWATQHLFHRVGRAMIRPIYAQKKTRDGVVGSRLKAALLWWRDVLSERVSETRPWVLSDSPPCHIFVDAASTPPRCAAVLAIAGRLWYTDVQPSTELMGQFLVRRDKQIMTLEILAIIVALSTFDEMLRSRKVIVYSDNVGAEHATEKGSCKAADHNLLVHEIWTHALRSRIHLWLERVPSAENISDSPSRFEYEMLEELGATWVRPSIAELYLGKD